MTYELKKEKHFIEISFEHESKELDSEYERQYSLLSKEIKLDGFRPGKVPVSIIKQIVKKDEIKKDVFNIFLKKEIDKLKLEESTIDEPEIEIIEENINTLKSKIKLNLFPTIKINDIYLDEIKKFKPEFFNNNFLPTDEDINNYINETIGYYSEQEEVQLDKEILIELFDFKEEEINDNIDLKKILDEKIKNILIEKERQRIDEDNYEKIIDIIVENSEVTISDLIIEKHKKEILEDFLVENQLDRNMTIEKLIEMTGNNNLENDLILATKNKITYYLLVTEINKKEKIFTTIIDDIENNKELSMEENLKKLFLNYQDNILEIDKNNFFISEANLQKFKNFIMKKVIA